MLFLKYKSESADIGSDHPVWIALLCSYKNTPCIISGIFIQSQFDLWSQKF